MNDLRERIDRLDDRLIALFIERMGLAAEVAAYKAAHGLPVLNPAREEEILERVRAAVDEELREHAETLYRALFAVSREYQSSLMK